MVSVEVLTVLVVLMTVVMMVWLIAQLARECGHEKAASVAEMRQKFVALRRTASRLRMSPEARQREIRSRTVDADDSTTSVNPVAIEMSDIYPSESLATGEIKVDDDVIDVRGGASVKKIELTYKNPTERNNQSTL